MKSKKYIEELRGMTKEDVKSRLRDLSEELMKLRFRKASGQLEKSHVVRDVKVKMAQASTVLKEASLKQ
jgi:large subunit ribosomal protein L29